jgi:hypothetical protein
MAEIEYRNVLRIDPMQPLAIRRLGVIDLAMKACDRRSPEMRI